MMKSGSKSDLNGQDIESVARCYPVQVNVSTKYSDIATKFIPFGQSVCFVPIDSDEALKRATLVRSDPSLIGVSRRNIATEEGQYLWEYAAPNGETIDEVEPIKRWNSLGLPPAWSDVWICPNARGHIQATGRDAKGRLQYRYHTDWTEVTTEMKYDDVVYFASQLPRLRKQVEFDLESKKMTLHTVSALVVRLIDMYNICLLYTSPSPRDLSTSRMPSSA